MIYRLLFPHGVANLTVRADATLTTSFAATFSGPAPEVREEPGVVSINYPRFNPFQWGRTSADVSLNPAHAWAIEVHGGVAHWSGELQTVELAGIEVRGGLSHVELTLPEPKGTVPFHVSGGASGVTLRRPAGVGARLVVGGGASKLGLDDQFFGAVGGPVRVQSPSQDATKGAYEIEIGGGASKVTVSSGIV
jgi:hypothetical protein